MKVKQRCGTCSHWTPKSTIEEIIEKKHANMPACTIKKKERGPTKEAGCFFWIQADDQEIKNRLAKGVIPKELILEGEGEVNPYPLL